MARGVLIDRVEADPDLTGRDLALGDVDDQVDQDGLP